MRLLSAAEAIGPAWERTQAIMLQPFNWRRYLKLAIVASFAHLASIVLSLAGDVPRVVQFAMPGKHLPTIAVAPIIGLLVLLILVICLLGLVVFYITSRLDFVLFSVVASGQTTIRPLWKKYGPATWRWILLKFLVGVASFIVLMIGLVATVPFFIGFVYQLSQSSDASNVVSEVGAGIVIALIAFFLGIFVFAIVMGIINTLLHDFTLPFIALEDLVLGAALTRLKHFVQDSPGEVTLYILLKFALTIAFGFVGEIVYLIFLAILAIPFAAVLIPMYYMLHTHGAGSMALFVVTAIIGGLLYVACMMFLTAVIFGYIYIFLQSYALYFMGGRYPTLGNLLEPPIAPPTEPTTVTA